MNEDSEVDSVIRTITNTLQEHKEKTAQGETNWTSAAVAMLISIITVALLTYQAFQAGRKKARAQYKADLKLEEKLQLEADAALAEAEEDYTAAMDRFKTLETEVNSLAMEWGKQSLRMELVRKQIDEITSWEEVDAWVDTDDVTPED